MKRSSSRAKVMALAHEAISRHSCFESPVNSADAHMRITRSAMLVSVVDAPLCPGLNTGRRAVAMNLPHVTTGSNYTRRASNFIPPLARFHPNGAEVGGKCPPSEFTRNERIQDALASLVASLNCSSPQTSSQECQPRMVLLALAKPSRQRGDRP